MYRFPLANFCYIQSVAIYLCIHLSFYLSADIDRDFSDAKKVLVEYLDKRELRDLFRELGLAHSTVQNHFENYGVDQYADSLLCAWINERDFVPTGEATWENLKTVLQSIRCNGAANQI